MSKAETEDLLEVPLPVAARELGVAWATAWRLLLQGALQGRQLENGRWMISVGSIRRLAKKARRPTDR